MVGGALVLLTIGLGSIPAAHYYYESSRGEGCARCHELRHNFDYWQNSTHRKINCTECHESSLETDLRRVKDHFFGGVPEKIHFGAEDVFAMAAKCQKCHRAEFAQWSAGPHSTTYARMFTNPEHNRTRHLMDDCLRCHGMQFDGPIRDLVTPIDTKGPWRLKNAAYGDRPAIPCLSCHAVHRHGQPMSKTETRVGATQELLRPSVAFYDRRSDLHMPVALLPLPGVREGTVKVKMSPDQRQALCYECHAPLATMQAGSGDDRTPRGVHEGLSCLACHQKHGQWTRQSCADCHPRLSNCGLDVEKMDTTFMNPKSTHNVHSVKCGECHPKGVPPRKVKSREPAPPSDRGQ
jgi:hypothetical protein